jgi:hypothetical protein
MFRTSNVVERIMYIVHGKRLNKVGYAWIRSTVLQADTFEDVVVMGLSKCSPLPSVLIYNF